MNLYILKVYIYLNATTYYEYRETWNYINKEEISLYVFNFSGCQNLKTVKSLIHFFIFVFEKT